MNKIGILGTDTEATQWPEVSISGHDYNMPPATRGIGGRQFVVLDFNPPPDFDVEAAIAELASTPKKRKAKAKDEPEVISDEA